MIDFKTGNTLTNVFNPQSTIKRVTNIINNISYRITGGTTLDPLYALNSTTIPTVNNVTIASNLATATAAAGSFVTWDYEADGAITKITPKFTMQLSGLTIDPTSATGSIKINYPNNNTLQVGSKILVTDGGVTTEQTIAGGSQANNNISVTLNNTLIDNLGLIAANPDNSLIITVSGAYGSPVSAQYSTDGGTSFTSNVQVYAGLNTNPINAVFGNGLFVFQLNDLNNSRHIILSTTDGISWNTAFVNVGNFGCGTPIVFDGTSFVIFNQGTKFTSSNGTTWNTTTTTGFPSAINYKAFVGLAFNGTDTYVVYSPQASGTSNVIYISTNNGINWNTITTPFSVSTATNYENNWHDFNTFTSDGYFYGFVSNTATSTSNVFRTIDFSSFELLTTPNAVVNGLFTLNNTQVFMSTTTAPYISHRLSGTSFVVNNILSNSPGKGNIFNYGNYFYNPKSYFAQSYQFTITSPSLPVPDAVYLGGQTLGYSVQETTTPSWQTTTLTYEDNAGTITATAGEYSATGTHVMLRVQNLNSGNVVSMVGADLRVTQTV